MKKNTSSSFFPTTFVIASFFLFVFIFYLHNLTRSIYGGDVGDLVAAAAVSGVAHPPGYPLLTLLGIAFLHFPLSAPPVTKMGLISVISALLTLFVFYRLLRFFFTDKSLIILTLGLLAFSYYFWFYGEIPEVFALNSLFGVTILYASALFYKTKKWNYLYLLALTAGLSLTNQHTIVFTFPGTLILLMADFRLFLKNKKKVFFSIIIFFAGLLPYLYIPIAARQNPPINWDDASTLPHFINLLLRKDYGGFAPGIVNQTPFFVKLLHVKEYFGMLLNTYTFPTVAVCCVGILVFFKKEKLLTLSILLSFFLSGPFFAFYSAPAVVSDFWLGVTERFYQLSFILILFFFPFGLFEITRFLRSTLLRPQYALIVYVFFASIAFLLFYFNKDQTDLSKTRMGDNYAYDLLSSLPKNTLYFPTGDTEAFNMTYLQFARGFRKDVLVFSQQTGRSGTFGVIDTQFNESTKKIKDPGKVRQFVFSTLKKQHPVFSSFPIDLQSKDFIAIPWGLSYQLIDAKELPDSNTYKKKVEKIWQKLHIPYREKLLLPERNLTITNIPTVYSNALINIGTFLITYYQDVPSAVLFYQKAVSVDNENQSAFMRLSFGQYLMDRNCSKAETTLKKAIELSIFPSTQMANYTNLYYLYKVCNEKTKQLSLEKFYKDKFKEKISSSSAAIE